VRGSIGAMQHRGKIVILLWLAACGDGGSTPTTSLTTLQPLTSGPSNETSNEVSGSTDVPTTTTPDSTMGGTEPTTTGTETTMVPPETTTTGGAAGAPVFLSFSTNVKKLTDGESVTFTAILTDPDGVDDIVGGSLLSEDESSDFGPFVAAGQPGTYSIVLSWDQIHQAAPINFENGEMPRVFQARFFDQKANKASKTAQIVLFCTNGGACDGVCKDFTADGDNCGTCGHFCEGGCVDGDCGPLFSSCFSVDGPLDRCDEMCESLQETCVENGCGIGSTVSWYDGDIDCETKLGPQESSQPCSEPQPWGVGILAVRCCCTDTK